MRQHQLQAIAFIGLRFFQTRSGVGLGVIVLRTWNTVYSLKVRTEVYVGVAEHISAFRVEVQGLKCGVLGFI